MLLFFLLPSVWWPDVLLPFHNDIANRGLFVCEVLAPIALLIWWLA